MSRLVDYLFAIAATLWVGALWAVGMIAAPTLFAQLQDRALAGDIAGALFRIVGWLGIGCASYLILVMCFRDGWRVVKSAVFWLVLVMLVLTCAAQFGVQPLISELRAELARSLVEGALRDRFAAWHGIASVLYLIQSALGIALVTQLFTKR